jgi:Peptidase family M23
MPATIADIFEGDAAMTQPFGARPDYYARFGLAGHEGIDFGLQVGRTLLAGVHGSVIKAGWGAAGGSAYGFSVEVWDSVQRVALAWCHMSRVDVSVGQTVEPQTVIGASGDTGNVEGAHLHFMVCQTDAGGTRLNTGNGFWGWLNALDPGIVTWAVGGITPPAPAPSPVGTATVRGLAGARIRKAPGTDQETLRQLAQDEQLTVKGRCHHPPALPDQNDSPGPDTDIWYLLEDDSGWVSDSVVFGTPSVPWLTDPTTVNPSPVPNPKPAHVDLGPLLVFETSPTYGPAADYAALKANGASTVAIRAGNGSGSGQHALMEQAWRDRMPQAKQVGLLVSPWNYWYGPSEGVTGDVAAYLLDCARYTAELNFHPGTVGWSIDAEDKTMPGLDTALQLLRDLTGKPVYLVPYGDPRTVGLTWKGPAIGQVVEAVMGQVYTKAWNGVPDPHGSTDAGDGLRAGWDELTNFFGQVPIIPVCDERDPVRIKAYAQAARDRGARTIGVWYWEGPQTLNVVSAFTSVPAPEPIPIPPPEPAPIPTPTPTPEPEPQPDDALPLLRQIWLELRALIRRWLGIK